LASDCINFITPGSRNAYLDVKNIFFSFPKIKNFVAFKFNYELGTSLPERRNKRKLSKDWEMQLANSEGDISVVVFNICPSQKQSLHQKY
jgi:hypothetical protein